MLTTVLGYLVVVQFFFLDRSRRGAEAKSFEAGKFDQHSTLYIGIAYFMSALALLASWLFNWFHVGILPMWVGWLGVVAALVGLLFRWWANRVLGTFYTRTLKVTENQSIVRAGPYRLIRHPGYLGSILIWTGAAAATANWIVLLIVLITMLAVYIYRIESEEKMLISAYTDYAEYRRHTWRLIPLVY
ncbi:MAG TPA: isoprenylcysteine carboxylmethyltransferase family protein [Anaerolineales bacterium]|nr:isoprenylcysteine carboxylmethyltransferase family protein [Anaerolineales bacterium]